MQLKSIELQELPTNEVLYLKRWQSNNFYPLEKAVRVENGYKVYWTKSLKWSEAYFEYTFEGFWYMLKHNYFLVSDTPMRDSTEFNFK